MQKYGVDFVRRMTGGGAVFHEHEITYSMHIPESSAYVPSGILESYKKICGGIIKGLARLDVHAQFVPLNDIVVVKNGAPKKVSGNAQTRKRGVILQHGTILLKVDVEKMFELLKVPAEKLKGKLIEDVKQRVTSLSDTLGRNVTFNEAFSALSVGFEEEFKHCKFEAGELTRSENKLVQKFKVEKYESEAWNMSR